MQLVLSQLSFSYPSSAHPLFDHIDITFPQGWCGLVGGNGCGKTTLARIIAGELEPDGGSVTPGLVVALCPQDASAAPEDLESFACDWGAEALRARRLLDIDDGWLWRYGTLSLGQKKRVQIACALARCPDVLILDEPTNHLDAPSRELLEAALAHFRGIGILISHDRALLDALAVSCLCFEADGLHMRPGGYGAAREQQKIEAKSAERLREEARSELRRLSREQQARREEAARSERLGSARHLDVHDHDGRERLGRARVSGKDGIASRKISQLDQRIGRLEKDASAKLARSYGGDLPEGGVRSARDYVAHLAEQTLPFGDSGSGIRIPELFVGPLDHIAVTGANGNGKSTLVRALVEAVPAGVKSFCLPQEMAPSERRALLAWAKGLGHAEQGALLSAVAQLDGRPESYREGDAVSPGELRKLALASAALGGTELLVLDEPTNHLDVSAIEALERWLASFPGAFVLVSHDRHLVSACADILWQTEILQSGEAVLVRA